MDFIKSEIKNIIIFAAILIGVFLAYNYFFKSETQNISTVSSVSDAVRNDELLGILSKIKAIKINTTLLQDPAFRSLRYTETILPRPDTGRPNPFIPVGTTEGETSTPAGASQSGSSVVGD